MSSIHWEHFRLLFTSISWAGGGRSVVREIPTLVVTVTQSFAMMRPHHKTIISLFLGVLRQTGTVTFFSLRRSVLVDCSRLWGLCQEIICGAVCLSVCVLVTNVKPAETDEPIEMSLGIGRQTHVCQMDRILWEGVLDVGGKCWPSARFKGRCIFE